jgi:membrane-associated phospholipid phosphatase
MTKLKENILYLSFILIIPLLSIIYPILNHNSNGTQSLVTKLDTSTPFIPEFIIPYVLWYPFIFLTLVYICYKNKKVYIRTLSSIGIGMLISFIIFYVFQTHVPRPIIEETDIFSNLVAVIYKNDKPFNCFPSLHVLESYLMIKGIYACSERNKAILWTVNITAVLIILSTLFIKQHVILDAIGAIYLAEIIFNLMPSLERIVLLFKKVKPSYTTNQ